MAVAKRVKIGGVYYKGYVCAVSSSTGDYTVIIVNSGGGAMNSLSIVPDTYGSGDTMDIQHFDDAGGTGSIVAVIGENLYNLGRSVPINLDFPAAERIDSGHSVKFIYSNAASKAMNVYIVAEYMGVQKTS